MNTAYLMQCTKILFALQITGSQIDLFQSNYQKYCETFGRFLMGSRCNQITIFYLIFHKKCKHGVCHATNPTY
ncbi:hypothetical protein VP01_2500g4 [Puccinia sorghi]|uniref:Uncharacterized protein n=1 Tax=Puccinia sorghi TaxID=27349 RepID=A0A0L6V5P0_9BASI|nr:hypothetical protein VP01_2500g4 [Puccinia sorghi]